MANDALIPGPLSTAQLREFQDISASGVLPRNKTTPALAASLIVKANQGKLFGFTVTNTKASAQFYQLFDSAVLPADATVPIMGFSVASGQAAGVYFGSVGRAFEQGIVLCNSSTQGSKTIGSADSLFDAQYL